MAQRAFSGRRRRECPGWLMSAGRRGRGAVPAVVICVTAAAACLFLSQRALASSASPQLGCAQRAESSAPTVFNDPRDKGLATIVRVGPIELHGGMAYASPRAFSQLRRRNGYVAAKVALVVQAGRSVRLKVSGASPDSVILSTSRVSRRRARFGSTVAPPPFQQGLAQVSSVRERSSPEYSN